MLQLNKFARSCTFSLILLVAVVLGSSCSKEKQFEGDFDPGKTVARVNGDTISQEFFEEYYIKSISRLGKNDTPEQRYHELNELINSILLKQEAEREGYKDSTYQVYEKVVTDKALNRMLIKKQVYDSLPPVNEAQLKTAFLRSNKDLYVRQLYFRHKDKAQEYYQRLEDGQDFVDLANELYRPNSTDYDSTAGYIGKISYFNVDDAFAEKAWSLPVNKYSKPFRTRLGYYIIRVENMDYNPMITERNYEKKKSKVEYLTKQRIYNLDADDFIRQKMEKKNVEPLIDNIRLLYEAIQRLPAYRRDLQKKKQEADFADAARLKKRLKPKTPLVRYTENGETKTFTALQYLKWLPHLPFGEARSRTTASVGRALRYETFAREAEQRGYLKSPAVQFEKDFLTTFFLSARMADSLNTRPTPEFTEDTLRKYYHVLDFDAIKSVPGTYWIVETKTKEKADQILADIKADKLDPATLENYQRYDDVDLLEHSKINANLRRLTQPMTSIMNVGDGNWYVFGLEKVERKRKTFEETRADIRNVLESGYNEVALMKRLRGKADIKVDTAAFESLMDYYDDISDIVSSDNPTDRSGTTD